MTASTVFFLLLVLACPLMMMLMMRGGHGQEAEARDTSTDDLRRQRAELDREIAEREQKDPERQLESRDWGMR